MIDFDSVIIKRLWAILEDEDGDFADLVSPANRIKLVTATSAEEDEGVTEFKTGWNDSDFPEVVIYSSGRADALWSQSRSYSMRTQSRETVVDITINIAIEVVHANMNPYQQRRLDDVITDLVRGAGPALGITEFPVFPVGPLTRRTVAVRGRVGEAQNTGSIKRFSTTHTLAVTIKTNSQMLRTP